MRSATATTEAALKTGQVKTSSFELPRLFGTTWEKLQFNYYAVIAFTLLAGSCIAGAAAANILENGAVTWQLGACAALAMFNNTTAIGNMPVKWVVWSFLIATMGNTILLLINI
jgi:hypothetical protein